MGKAVIVLVFPEPEHELQMGIIIKKAQGLYADMPEVKAHLAINKAADEIVSFLETGIGTKEKNGEM